MKYYKQLYTNKFDVLHKIDKLILKFVWKFNGLKLPKQFLKKKVENLQHLKDMNYKTSYKGTVNKTI